MTYPIYINYFVWFSVDLYYYVEFLFIIIIAVFQGWICFSPRRVPESTMMSPE